MFSLGGNAGFALGPLLMTPAVLAFGLHGTALALIPLWLGAGLLVGGAAAAADVRAGERAGGRATATAATGRDAWGPFARLGVGGRAALGRVLRAAGVRPGLLRPPSSGRARRPATRRCSVMLVAGAVRDLRRRAADRPDRAAGDPGRLDGAARARCSSLFLLVGALAGDAAAGRHRLRRDLELLGHRRDGPGVPAEPARARLGDHARRRDRVRRRSPRRRSARWRTRTSLDTTMWVIALTPLPALLLALSLPPTSTDRRLRAERHESPAEAGPSVPVMDRQ